MNARLNKMLGSSQRIILPMWPPSFTLGRLNRVWGHKSGVGNGGGLIFGSMKLRGGNL